jgi:hypothetical protein
MKSATATSEANLLASTRKFEDSVALLTAELAQKHDELVAV